MRRGLLKDLANTPTAIACGWRLYADIQQLRALDGSVVTIDLLSGTVVVEGEQLSGQLFIANDVIEWMRERLAKDGIPPGMVTGAQLMLTPHADRGLRVDCRTVISTVDQTFESSDTARWHKGDAK